MVLTRTRGARSWCLQVVAVADCFLYLYQNIALISLQTDDGQMIRERIWIFAKIVSLRVCMGMDLGRLIFVWWYFALSLIQNRESWMSASSKLFWKHIARLLKLFKSCWVLFRSLIILKLQLERTPLVH